MSSNSFSGTVPELWQPVGLVCKDGMTVLCALACWRCSEALKECQNSSVFLYVSSPMKTDISGCNMGLKGV